MTVLPHAFTYFMGDDALFMTRRGALACGKDGCGMTARASWGPHFGTLAYRASLFSEARGVTFPATSEAEDYSFAQRAVTLAHARLHVVEAQSSSAEPLFVCVRHTSNTWRWSDSTLQRFSHGEGARPVPVSVLRGADRAFAVRMRSGGVVDALAARRAASPAPNRYPDPWMRPAFFDALYAGATSLDASSPLSTATAVRLVGAPGPIKYFDVGSEWDFRAHQACLQSCFGHASCPCNSSWHYSTYDPYS